MLYLVGSLAPGRGCVGVVNQRLGPERVSLHVADGVDTVSVRRKSQPRKFRGWKRRPAGGKAACSRARIGPRRPATPRSRATRALDRSTASSNASASRGSRSTSPPLSTPSASALARFPRVSHASADVDTVDAARDASTPRSRASLNQPGRAGGSFTGKGRLPQGEDRSTASSNASVQSDSRPGSVHGVHQLLGLAARNNVRMAFRIGSGSVGQASMSAARSGSSAGFSRESAPLFAPPGARFVEFSGKCARGSSPLGGI
jgi:hypothetical protein